MRYETRSMRYEARRRVPPQELVRSRTGPSGVSSRFLVEYPLERYELYAHRYLFNASALRCSNFANIKPCLDIM
jgi:hypothetical protein